MDQIGNNNDGIGNSDDHRPALTPARAAQMRRLLAEELPPRELVRQQRRYRTSAAFRRLVDEFDTRNSREHHGEQAGATAFAQLTALLSPLITEDGGSDPHGMAAAKRPSPAQVESMWQKIQTKIGSGG